MLLSGADSCVENASAPLAFTAHDRGLLVSLVKHAQRAAMAGSKGCWKEFLKARCLQEHTCVQAVAHSCTA